MIAFLHRHVLPAAYALLPPAMSSPAATAMLLAIALQESKCAHRRQFVVGPARGLWQFEKGGGIHGVLMHEASRPAIEAVLRVLCYPATSAACYAAVEHNDVLAAAFARCLLWTDPAPLPSLNDMSGSYEYYKRVWRPGKPRPADWPDNCDRAVRIVTAETGR